MNHNERYEKRYKDHLIACAIVIGLILLFQLAKSWFT